MNAGLQAHPEASSSAPQQLGSDLYPTLTELPINDRVGKVLRQGRLNPTQIQQQFDKAHASGDYLTKAKLAQQVAFYTDQIQGGSAATNWLDSHRIATPDEVQSVYNSVSTGQAFFGSIKNGFVDMAEAVPQLLTAGAGFTGLIDKGQWDKAHKGIEETFSGLKTYVSQDYNKPLVSYDDQDGIQFDLNFKSLVGTTGNLMSYILPGLLTAGAGSLATIGTRAALRGATTVAERALLTSQLAKVGSVATKATGLSAFLQTFPSYQREALASGLDLHDATLYAIPVAGINAVIETANMGPLTKALGISENAAKAAIRQASLREATEALVKLPKGFTTDMLIEAGQEASKKALGIISRPEELGAFGKLVSTIGGKLKRGFIEQGLPEGGEEFFQSLVENGSKQIYNNLADSDSTGRFKDPSFGQYAFDAIYGTALGALVGTLPGTFLHSKQADPTVFGYVGANVRDGLRKNVALTDLLSNDPENPARLKMLGVLDNKLQKKEISPEDHADLTQKVGRMAQIASDFAGVEGFTEADRHTMFAVSEAKHSLSQTDQEIASAKSQYEQLSQAGGDSNASMGERIKSDIAKGQVARTLGGIVDTENGQVFAAEQRQQQRSEGVNRVVEQAMSQYANDEARAAINAFVKDGLETNDRNFGQTSFPDDFAPTKLLQRTPSGKLLVTDNNKLTFRELTQEGGKVIEPGHIDENGVYIPSTRSPRTDTYANPVADLSEHLRLASALEDKNSPVEAVPYRKPDNSVEANYLADGRDLVERLGQLSQTKKKKETAAVQQEAASYLTSSALVSTNPDYAPEFDQIATTLQSLIGDNKAVQSEDTAQPIGENVDLMAEGTADSQTQQSTPATNVQSAQTQLSFAPDILATSSESQAVEPDYIDELHQSTVEEQRRDAGSQLSQSLDAALGFAGSAESANDGFDGRLEEQIAAANESLAAEHGLYAEPDQSRPADEGATGAESVRQKKRAIKPAEFAKSFVPVDVQSAILSFFARRGKINQSDFDRVAGESMRKTEKGGNPFINYLDPKNQQPPLDTIGRSIADSLGMEDSDQQSIEQAIVDSVLGFSKGNGPSVQLLAYSEASIEAESEAALNDALDSMSDADRATWEPYGDAFGAVESEATSAVDNYSDEEVAQLLESLAANGYINDDGTIDSESLIGDAPAIRSGLLAIDPASIDLYEQFIADLLTPQRTKSITDELSRTHTQITASLAENGSDGNTAENVDPENSGIEQTSPDNESGSVTGGEGTKNGIESISDAELDNRIDSLAASDPEISQSVAPLDIALADNQKQIEAKQKEIDALKSQVRSEVKTGDLFEKEAPSIYPKAATRPTIFTGNSNGVNPDGSLLSESGEPILQVETSPTTQLRVVKTSDGFVGYMVNDAEGGRVARPVTYRNYQIDPAFEAVNPVRDASKVTDLVTVKPAEFKSDGTLRTKGQVFYQSSETYDEWRQKNNKSAQKQNQNTDLFAGDTSGIEAQGAARKAIEKKEGELAALKSQSATLSDEKIAAIQSTIDASRKQTSLAFQLNEASDNTPLGNMATRLSEAFGVQIVTNPDAYNQAIADANVTGLLGDRKPIAFRYKGVIYLSPQANAQSLLHEAGGLLVEGMRTASPELYAKGVALVKESKYFKQLALDPYYKTLSEAEKEVEALETAIGDLGAQFVLSIKKNTFRQLLADAWNSIKEFLGITSSIPIEQMTLGDFVQEATGQLFSGETQVSPDINQGVAFQLSPPPFNARHTDVPTLHQQAIDELRATPKGIQNNLAAKKEFELTKADKAYIQEIAEKTGFKLVKGKLEWTRDKNFFHGVDNSTLVVDPAELAASIDDNFSKGINAEGNKGFVFRKMFDLLKANTSLESFIRQLDNAQQSLRQLIIDPQRQDALKADYVHNTLKGTREAAEPLLAPFTTLLGNNMANVRKATVKTYSYDENGNVGLVDIELPVSFAMALAQSTMTQYASHGQASGVTLTEPRADSLYTKESNGRLTRNVYGEFYENPETKEVTQLLIPKAEADKLIDRFRRGMGAYKGEVEAFAALYDHFNQDSVVETMEEVANQLNPDDPFRRVVTQSGKPQYYPITSVQSETDARNQSRERKKTLDENRRILKREGAPKATLLLDPVASMRSFENSVTDVISYGRTVENLTGLVNSLDKYQGPKKAEIKEYLEDRIKKLQNYRQQLADQQKAGGGVVRVFDTIMRKYGRAVLNSVGSGLKQSVTYGGALATNILEGKYLKDSEALGVLASLTGAGYRDITARGDLDITGESTRGLEGAGGYSTAERPYIESLLGNDIADPDAKKAHLRRWATVIQRALGSPSSFVDGAQFEDFGLNEQSLNAVQKKIKQADQFADRYFTTINQRVDRAVVFAWMRAAELQGKANGLTDEALDEFMANKTTAMLYENYSLSNLTTRTPLSLSNNFILKMLGLYSAQAQTQGNLLLRAVADWSKSESGSAEETQALQQLYKTAGWAILFNAIGVSIITSLSRALIAALSGDPIDEPEQMIAQIGFDTIKNISGSFPSLATTAADYLISTNDTINSGGNDALIDFPAAELIEKGLDSINNAGTILFSQDEKEAEKSLNALIRDIPSMSAKALGIPVNIQRVITEGVTVDKDDQ